MKQDFAVHIVDDDPAIRESLKMLMQEAGHEVHCHTDGRAFLDVAAVASGCGCALLDLRMQDIDGPTVQTTLTSQGSNIDVIMMSAYGDIGLAVQAMRRGAVDFVEKPFDPDELLASVDRLAAAAYNGGDRQREARQKARLVATLTPRENDVMRGIVDGLSNKQVAAQLGISARTVETHRVHIMQKLSADSLAVLVRIWIASGDGARLQA